MKLKAQSAKLKAITNVNFNDFTVVCLRPVFGYRAKSSASSYCLRWSTAYAKVSVVEDGQRKNRQLPTANRQPN
jgi:hypothetical protein